MTILAIILSTIALLINAVVVIALRRLAQRIAEEERRR